ncbi:MAG: TetR/AcrR family transcriptional regulator C-terminal domain-containing protein [Acidimicrobiales bacterium]
MPRRSSTAPAERPFHRGLNRDAVLAAALHLIDDEGRGALTMRRLAADLDVEAPSLYTHVRNKEDLVDAVLDRVLDTVPLPSPDQPWRDALIDGFSGYRAALIAHPAVVPLITERGRRSVAQLRLVERSIVLLEGAGLTTVEAVQAQVTLVGYTIGFVVQETGRSPDLPVDVLASSEVLPRTMDALLSLSVDERFRAGLELILAGIAAEAR